MRSSSTLTQKVVLIASFLPPITTFLMFGLGTSFGEATASAYSRPLIEPAGYAFIIWSMIYVGAAAFGIYQHQKAQQANQLVSACRLPAASAYAGTAAWLVMARLNLQWLTVLCIFWIFFSLLVVFLQLMRKQRSFTTTEMWCVHLPFSIFFGWLSVAIFANTASALKTSDFNYFQLSEAGFTLLLLLLALCLGGYFVARSRGNLAYAATILWALVGIAVANLQEGQSRLVATGAGMGALLVLFFTLYFRRRTVSR